MYRMKNIMAPKCICRLKQIVYQCKSNPSGDRFITSSLSVNSYYRRKTVVSNPKWRVINNATTTSYI